MCLQYNTPVGEDRCAEQRFLGMVRQWRLNTQGASSSSYPPNFVKLAEATDIHAD
jgi:thiamine pyrophosphate-dependent acetolactate synthase large subunit-like protein